MKLVICLPSGHVTVVKWISEGRKAFDTSLRSVKTLTCVPGAGGGGPCRLLGAPTPGKARLGRGRAGERHLAPCGGSNCSRAPPPTPRTASWSEGWGGVIELGRTPCLELGTQIGSLSSGPSADLSLRIPPPSAMLTDPQGALGCVSLGMLLGVSVPWFPHLSQGARDITNALPTHQVNIKGNDARKELGTVPKTG